MEENRQKDGNKKEVHPYKEANILSKIFFIWLLPLFYKGYKKDLSEDDIFPTLKEHDSTTLGDKLERAWKNELRNKNDPSLWKALIKVFSCELAWLAVWYMFTELFVRLTQPLALSKLLEYYEPHSTMTKNEAYMYSGFIVLSAVVTMLSQHNFMLHQFNLGVKIRVSTSALVYRKALKLSRSSLIETNIGQMVNLISNDVGRFESGVKQIHSVWLAPVELVVILVLLNFYVGPTGMVGIAFLSVFIPFQMWLGKKTSVFRLNTAIKTDERIHLMNEIINGIQVIKMYTWEKPFAKLVEISRRKEMQQIQKTSTIRACIMSFQLFINKTAVYFCILVFVLTGNIANAQYVYVITSFYSILRTVVTKRFPEGVTQLAEAGISVKRIKEFLMREEVEFDFKKQLFNRENQKQIDNGLKKKQLTPEIKLTNVCVKWNRKLDDNSLENVSINVSSNELAVVIGPVGSGKTTLLHTILKELFPLSGSVDVIGRVSYASQEPWLFMSSIRQNIIFGQEFVLEKYEEVVRVCALETDFVLFPYGDKTLVGERGVSLSGGQRARINLARAVYKDADIYLLDDPLSAVDTHVGKHIFEECVTGYLRHKCVVLVTHQLQYLKNALKIYLMDNGTMAFTGNYEQVQNSKNDFAKVLGNLKDIPDEDCLFREETSDNKETRTNGVTKGKQEKESKGPKIVKESRGVGTISSGVYKTFFKNGGNWCHILFIFMVFLIVQIISSASDYYLTWWVNTEAIRKARGEIDHKLSNNNLTTTQNSTDIYDGFNKSTNELVPHKINTTNQYSPFQEFWLNKMSDEICLIVYSGFVMLLIVLSLSRSLFFFRFCIKASVNLHNNMFDKIVYATMRFFNVNPSGRIMNRFSKDMNQVDEALPITMIDTIQNGLTVLFTTIVVATVNPWMLLPTVIILAIFYYLRIVYLSTSRNVKRIEGTTRSPVYSHLSASLQGLTTIRAFEAQDILSKEFDQHQNKNSSAFLTFIAIGRCFGLWLDVHCTIYIALVTMSFLLFKTDTLGGFVGLSITQSLTLTGMFQWCIRQWSELENAMTCVERIKEYVDVVPENEKNIKEPPKNWPAEGNLIFKNLTLRYASDEPPVLKSISFSVASKAKVGIVGRTGAGKSSIIVALFRLAENEGIISIDGVDTSTVSLEKLRSIIPQEPVLFSGTLRKNLDPFDEFNDKILWATLEEVELKEAVADLPHGLESRMSEGGSNFSVGQRQLVCLARAVLRKNKILVLDEATANVDPQTDALIQTTIRRKFSDCTVLTIAHRLHTIMDSNKVLVMDAGRVVEFGTPFELLQNGDGVFYEMVQQTGKAMADNLLSIAEKSHQEQTKEK